MSSGNQGNRKNIGNKVKFESESISKHLKAKVWLKADNRR